MAKGASFERKVATHLSLWWTGGKHDDTIWRTSQSGGRATSRRQKGKRTSGQAGDLCSTDPASRGLFVAFGIELKCGYQSVTINDLTDQSPRRAFQKDGWDGWVSQAEAAMIEGGAKAWMLIHHRTRGQRRTMVYFGERQLKKNLPDVYSLLSRCASFLMVRGLIHDPTLPTFRVIPIVGARYETLFDEDSGGSIAAEFRQFLKAATKKEK